MRKNILLLAIPVSVIYALWILGLQFVFIKALELGINLVLSPFDKVSCKLVYDNNLPEFEMSFPAIINGKSYTISPTVPLTPAVLPFVLMLSWQVFLFFHFPVRKALRIAAFNMGLIYTLQALFPLILFDYKGEYLFLTILKDTFLHAFIIVVLFLCAKDIYLYDFFRNEPKFSFRKAKSAGKKKLNK